MRLVESFPDRLTRFQLNTTLGRRSGSKSRSRTLLLSTSRALHRCFTYFIPSSLHNRTLLMPQGTPFDGLIPPFPIRVDQFDTLPGVVPALHLLSHTHSDHIQGLSAKSFGSTIICSNDAKQMLLRYEVYSERALRDVDLRDEARLSRAFGHLKIPPSLKDGRLDFSASRDLLVCRIHMQMRESLLTFKPENPPS